MLDATTLNDLQTGRDLTFDAAFGLCERLLDGAHTDEQVAGVLVLLADKGETAVEIHGFVSCLLSHAERMPFDRPTIDPCGTGGSGLIRFNVSTAVAFVLAADGCIVAKHGNRG